MDITLASCITLGTMPKSNDLFIITYKSDGIFFAKFFNCLKTTPANLTTLTWTRLIDDDNIFKFTLLDRIH